MLFLGNDWAEAHHDIELQDEHGRVLARRRLPKGVQGLALLLNERRARREAPLEGAQDGRTGTNQRASRKRARRLGVLHELRHLPVVVTSVRRGFCPRGRATPSCPAGQIEDLHGGYDIGLHWVTLPPPSDRRDRWAEARWVSSSP